MLPQPLHVARQVLRIREAGVVRVLARLPRRESISWLSVAKPVITSALLKPVKGGK